jgi:hypothetical protein
MARQNLVVVTGPAPQSSQIMSGFVTRAPVVAQTAAGAAASLNDSKGMSRCQYINSLLNGMTIKPPM